MGARSACKIAQHTEAAYLVCRRNSADPPQVRGLKCAREFETEAQCPVHRDVRDPDEAHRPGAPRDDFRERAFP